MAEKPITSPDGKFIWTGDEWIPAPSNQLEVQTLETPDTDIEALYDKLQYLGAVKVGLYVSNFLGFYCIYFLYLLFIDFDRCKSDLDFDCYEHSFLWIYPIYADALIHISVIMVILFSSFFAAYHLKNYSKYPLIGKVLPKYYHVNTILNYLLTVVLACILSIQIFAYSTECLSFLGDSCDREGNSIISFTLYSTFILAIFGVVLTLLRRDYQNLEDDIERSLSSGLITSQQAVDIRNMQDLGAANKVLKLLKKKGLKEIQVNSEAADNDQRHIEQRRYELGLPPKS